MMIEEIKPCPFCGSDRLDHASNGYESVYAECENCGASGPSSENYTAATSSWNKRASDAEIATLTAKLAESEKQLAEAMKDALEKAAKVREDFKGSHRAGVFNAELDRCAAAIRAMKEE